MILNRKGRQERKDSKSFAFSASFAVFFLALIRVIAGMN